MRPHCCLLLNKLRLKFWFQSYFFEEPVARISPNGFSMGILAICFSLFCYLFIFYTLIYIYLVTMCNKIMAKNKINWNWNLISHRYSRILGCFALNSPTRAAQVFWSRYFKYIYSCVQKLTLTLLSHLHSLLRTLLLSTAKWNKIK